MTGTTWFCGCGEKTCRNTYIDLERIVYPEAHITMLQFTTGDDDGVRSVLEVPVVLLAMMLDMPEEEQDLEFDSEYGWLTLNCYSGDFDMETPDGYTSLLIDEEFVEMLRKEVFDAN